MQVFDAASACLGQEPEKNVLGRTSNTADITALQQQQQQQWFLVAVYRSKLRFFEPIWNRYAGSSRHTFLTPA